MVSWRTGREHRLGAGAFAGAHVVVAGWGMTGQSAATVLADMGAKVTVLNAAPPHNLPDAAASGIEFIIASEARALADRSAHLRANLLIASPGWAPHHPVLSRWGGPVWSDIELAWHIADPATRWLTLTGTNGKTTTIGMVAAILDAAGRSNRVVGNVGVPIVRTVWDARAEGVANLAVELSSFQLHHVHSVSAAAAAVLNLADDHLDWHGGAEEYAGAKARIYTHARAACVYNAQDPATRRMVEEADVVEGARAVGFTLAAPRIGELGIVEGALVDRAFIDSRATHGQIIAEPDDLAHLGGPGGLAPHTLANALAAAALTLADGVSHAHVRTGLANFRSARHRLQPLSDVRGVHFVNDSKATNAHAAAASLSAMEDGRVVWILGGLAKGAEFDDLVRTWAHKLRAAVLIGVDPAPFARAIARHAPSLRRETIDPGHDEIMSEAVRVAHDLARAGDTVLLAPAGASMDQFESYEARGDAFIAAAHALGGAPTTPGAAT